MILQGYIRASSWLSWERICLVMQETQVRSLHQEDPLEKEMATHSSILAREIPMDRGEQRSLAGYYSQGCSS